MSLISVNDVLKITTRVEKIHPYKVVGDRDSYSPYNEGWSDCVSLIEHYLEQIPFAEPERKTGKWIDGKPYVNSHWKVCSVCHESAPDSCGGFNFCPNCGADMRGEEWQAGLGMQEDSRMTNTKLSVFSIGFVRRSALMLRLLTIWNFGVRIVLFRLKAVNVK